MWLSVLAHARTKPAACMGGPSLPELLSGSHGNTAGTGTQLVQGCTTHTGIELLQASTASTENDGWGRGVQPGWRPPTVRGTEPEWGPAGMGTHARGLCRALGHSDAAGQRMTCSITHPCDGSGSSPHPSPGSGSPAAASRRAQHCAGTRREGSTAKSLLCPQRCRAAGDGCSTALPSR